MTEDEISKEELEEMDPLFGSNFNFTLFVVTRLQRITRELKAIRAELARIASPKEPRK